MTTNRRWPVPLIVVLAAYTALAVALASFVPLRDEARDWGAALVSGGWMAWTFPTALFFLTIFLRLARGTPPHGHTALRDDARRSPLFIAAWQRLYPPRLAGAHRPQPVVGSRSLRGLRDRRVSLRIEREIIGAAACRRLLRWNLTLVEETKCDGIY